MTRLARHLLLAALLLRALVPLGWMPGSAQLGQAAWIICTADGAIQHGTPGKDDGQSQHQPPCAFAAAHIMASPQALVFAAPLLQAAVTQNVAAPAAVRPRAAFTPQAARAPPIFT
jgi:hypothetical protein